MPELDRDGVAIHYEVHGPHAGEARGPALLLSHGYGATTQMWNGNLPALARDRVVVTWDIRGHGRSDSPDDPALYSEELSVQDMAAVLDAVGEQTAVIGGLSLGGYLSLAFNIRYPKRVTALVLCDTGPGYKRDEPREQWNDTARRRADQLDTKGLAALGESAEVRDNPHRSARGLALAARHILTQRDPSVIESLPTIKVPTLVLVGADDKPFLTAADVMAAKIPGATKAVIPGAGHAANIDQPEAFDEAVLGFLATL
ncbi:MAG TPA: alpha/beta fold hydrolase [Acidimicrobiales bacterium]|nr:alpha/beta fold hydrolase [Acidimicrobiales bacterium]